MFSSTSVVVTNFNVIRIAIDEAKADSPLIVDRNRVLTFSVIFERVQPVPRRHLKIVDRRRKVYVLQLARGAGRNVGRKAFGRSGEKEIARTPVRERLDHATM
jgi:hypothetical protein